MLRCYSLLNSDLDREKQACSMCFELQSNRPLLDGKLQRKDAGKRRSLVYGNAWLWGRITSAWENMGCFPVENLQGALSWELNGILGKVSARGAPRSTIITLPQNIHLYTSQILFWARKIMVKCSTLVTLGCYVMSMYSKKPSWFQDLRLLTSNSKIIHPTPTTY